jgi:hypothetical protein
MGRLTFHFIVSRKERLAEKRADTLRPVAQMHVQHLHETTFQSAENVTTLNGLFAVICSQTVIKRHFLAE